MSQIKKILLGKAECAIDLGDGSERGEYVSQDYILNVLGRPMRAVSLMTSYYPLDETFPTRAHDAFSDKEITFQWDYPYDDYETYKGGLIGELSKEPFNWMRDVRKHGQDVCLTVTMDTNISDDHIKAMAKDLSTFGRVMLRVNHEAGGDWFSFTKRASYEDIALFFAHVCDIFHEEAKNVKLILCLNGLGPDNVKIEKEEEFTPAIKACDIFSMDRYMSLHWGWPYDIAKKDTKNYYRETVANIYDMGKRTAKRFEAVAGEKRPMVLSEMNADGDVTGPYEQCDMLKEFCDMLKADSEKWLEGFTFYQFRDRGRLGLEWEDPNNSEVGIKLPLMDTFKEIINDEYFMPKISEKEDISIPVKLRWGSAEDSEGVAIPLSFEKEPVFCEAYFEDELKDANLMMELNGRWFYKAPGTTFVDFMPAFFEGKKAAGKELTLKIFAPPATGENDSSQGDDWTINWYYTLNKLPEIRIEYEAVI
ncbi:MAG: hypothetical protein J6X97_04935 [Lachnospiraceae bacterium]|nr:hypothetical protein [Lachnospiraceae bacterium]